MAKFHLNPKGEPGVCKALTACPFGGDEAHYGSKAEAQRAYEQTQGGGGLAGMKRAKAIKLPKAVTHSHYSSTKTITPEREALYHDLLATKSTQELTTLARALADAYQAIPHTTAEPARSQMATQALSRLSPVAQAMAAQHDVDERGEPLAAYDRLRAAYVDGYNLSRYKTLTERRASAKPIAPYTDEDRAAIKDALAHIDFPRGVAAGQGATPKNAIERLALGVHQAAEEGWSQEAQAKFHSSFALKQLEKQHGIRQSAAYSRLLGAINDEGTFEAVVNEPEVQQFLSEGIKGKRLSQNSNLEFDRAVVGEAFRKLGPARAGRLLNEVNGKSMSIVRFFGEVEALEPR